jgi:nitroimidazol reductase NimA-like FMN-containing flavoprotein (pyridoxamine 5'-phosphate oxidase superfamily)
MEQMSTGGFLPTERTRVRRLPQRAAYDRATVHGILDAGIVCHLGFVEGGRPVVIPTAYARVGDVVYVHGSSKSRTLCVLADGVEVCLTVALIDGLVLARSAFHHSINYRSVVVFGRARSLEDDVAKLAALEAFTERLHPGRWREVRPPSPPELKATKVLELPLEEAVAKCRSGGPLDDAEDYALPVWAGVLPLALVRGDPIPDPGFTARSD